MTLIFKLDLDILPPDLHTKIQGCMFVRWALRARQTHTHTDNAKTITPVADAGCNNRNSCWHLSFPFRAIQCNCRLVGFGATFNYYPPTGQVGLSDECARLQKGVIYPIVRPLGSLNQLLYTIDRQINASRKKCYPSSLAAINLTIAEWGLFDPTFISCSNQAQGSLGRIILQ